MDKTFAINRQGSFLLIISEKGDAVLALKRVHQ